MTEKTRMYRELIDRMLDDMSDDEHFHCVVYTIVHRHYLSWMEKKEEKREG